MKNKTLIFIGIGTAVLIVALILILTNSNDDENEGSSSSAANNLISTLPQRGYPIRKGVSKRKEVQDMQKILKQDFGADLGTFGTDGDWGDTTEREVLKYLKVNEFNSLGHLKSIISFNKVGSFI